MPISMSSCMKPFARKSRDFDLEGFFRIRRNVAAPLIGWTRICARRKQNVVAKPAVLTDVRRRYRNQLLAIYADLISGEQPRLIHEETVRRIRWNEAISSGAQGCASLSNKPGIIVRLQADQRIVVLPWMCMVVRAGFDLPVKSRQVADFAPRSEKEPNSSSVYA